MLHHLFLSENLEILIKQTLTKSTFVPCNVPMLSSSSNPARVGLVLQPAEKNGFGIIHALVNMISNLAVNFAPFFTIFYELII